MVLPASRALQRRSRVFDREKPSRQARTWPGDRHGNREQKGLRHMSKRIPIVLSSAALAVALLGSTGIVQAARDAVIPAFAKNAGAVGGIKASKSARAGELLPLGKNKKFPASVVPAGPKGPQGAQ